MNIQERLDEIKGRCEKATKGPWDDDTMRYVEIGGHLHLAWPIGNNIPLTNGFMGEGVAVVVLPEENESRATIEQCAANCAFIEESREDIPWLISQVETLRRETIEECLNIVSYDFAEKNWEARGLEGKPEYDTLSGTMIVLRKAIRALAEEAPDVPEE